MKTGHLERKTWDVEAATIWGRSCGHCPAGSRELQQMPGPAPATICCKGGAISCRPAGKSAHPPPPTWKSRRPHGELVFKALYPQGGRTQTGAYRLQRAFLPFLPAFSPLLPMLVLSSVQLRAQKLMNKVDKAAATVAL